MQRALVVPTTATVRACLFVAFYLGWTLLLTIAQTIGLGMIGRGTDVALVTGVGMLVALAWRLSGVHHDELGLRRGGRAVLEWAIARLRQRTSCVSGSTVRAVVRRAKPHGIVLADGARTVIVDTRRVQVVGVGVNRVGSLREGDRVAVRGAVRRRRIATGELLIVEATAHGPVRIEVLSRSAH